MTERPAIYKQSIFGKLCSELAKLRRWTAIHRRVLLTIDDTADASLFGIVLLGTIEEIVDKVLTSGPEGATYHNDPCPIIRLDSPLLLKDRKLQWLIAVPRFGTYYRLQFLSLSAYVLPLSNPTPHPQTVFWNEILFGCTIRTE